MEEEHLIIRCQNGDTEAFEELVTPYMGKMINVAHAILQDREGAYDAAQETFLKAFKYIKKFGGRSSFYTWLYRICVNVCMDAIQTRKRNATVDFVYRNKEGEEVDGMDQIPDDAPSPEQLVGAGETRRQIARAMNQLPDEYRTAIVLRELENMRYDDIAKVLKCPVGTVRSRINRARKRLQEILIENEKLFE